MTISGINGSPIEWHNVVLYLRMKQVLENSLYICQLLLNFTYFSSSPFALKENFNYKFYDL